VIPAKWISFKDPSDWQLIIESAEKEGISVVEFLRQAALEISDQIDEGVKFNFKQRLEIRKMLEENDKNWIEPEKTQPQSVEQAEQNAGDEAEGQQIIQ
jgi:hypothetical protein